MANPRVSIIMATYRRPQFIARAVESAAEQTFKDWELIISDDSEDDLTEKAVLPLAARDPRIRYFHRPQKGSIANSSNFALGKARGEFVAILDDDDWWMDRGKLSLQTSFLEKNPQYIGCGGAFVIVSETGEERRRIMKPETDAAIRRVALYANPMANSTTMFRRKEAGTYDESMPQFADWDFWLRAGTKGKLYNFPKYFLAYRMWREGASFAHQKQNADVGYRIVLRYRKAYPGFWRAFVLAWCYRIYARFPAFIRRGLNASLSQLKKLLFSK